MQALTEEDAKFRVISLLEEIAAICRNRGKMAPPFDDIVLKADQAGELVFHGWRLKE